MYEPKTTREALEIANDPQHKHGSFVTLLPSDNGITHIAEMLDRVHTQNRMLAIALREMCLAQGMDLDWEIKK